MSDSDEMPPLEDEGSERQQGPVLSSPSTSAAATVCPADVAGDCADSDSDEDGWQEAEELLINNKAKCLFCEECLACAVSCLAHMIDVHGFDVISYVTKYKLDQISYIKLVNYIRRENVSAEQLYSRDPAAWNSADNMKPVIEEDPLLMHDVEELSNNQEEIEENYDSAYLRATCNELRQIITKQREVMQRMLQAFHTSKEKKGPSIRTVGDMRPEEDEGYFNSYAHFDIHHEMLSDQVRTESYRDAILNNSSALRGRRVLDLGCGTSILSMFCAQAGAMVTGVDMSDVIYQAMDIIKENNLENTVALKKGRLEDLHFDEQFDFIVSEWMGYFLLFEGMLDSVLYARDKHLAEGGLLLPNRCTMHLLGIDDIGNYKKYVSFWDDVYGFKMSCMKKEVVKAASTDIVKEANIITSTDKIADFDLMKISPSDTEFTAPFSLTCTTDGQITCLVGYFDAYFDMPNPVFFSTGPQVKPTHWKQTLFYLPHPRPVQKGDVFLGKISVRRKTREVRSLHVGITVDNQLLNYLVE